MKAFGLVSTVDLVPVWYGPNVRWKGMQNLPSVETLSGSSVSMADAPLLAGRD